MRIRTRTAKQLATERPPVWKLGYLDVAARDARKFLTDDQYAHVIQQFDDLAAAQNPRLSHTQDVRPIEGFYELRDKGGILGKINLRVYFAVFDERKLILVAGAYKKEDDGQTPGHIRTRIRNRLRHARQLLAESAERREEG